MVVRVIRLGTPNLFISAAENDVTRSNMTLRSVLAKLAAVAAAKYPHSIALAILPSAYASINPPFFQTLFIVGMPAATSCVSLDV